MSGAAGKFLRKSPVPSGGGARATDPLAPTTTMSTWCPTWCPGRGARGEGLLPCRSPDHQWSGPDRCGPFLAFFAIAAWEPPENRARPVRGPAAARSTPMRSNLPSFMPWFARATASTILRLYQRRCQHVVDRGGVPNLDPVTNVVGHDLHVAFVLFGHDDFLAPGVHCGLELRQDAADA